MKRIVLLTVCAVMMVAAHGMSFDLSSVRSTGMGRGVLLSEPSATVLTVVPIADGNDAWAAELGGSRRFDLGDLDEFSAALGFRRERFTVAAGVAQFGRTDLYAETTARVAVGYAAGSFGFGGSVSGRLISFGGGYEDLHAGTVGFSASWRLEPVRVALVADDLTRPKLHEDAVPFNRTLDLYLELLTPGSYQVTGSARFEEDEAPRFGLGQRLELVAQAAFFWGLTSEPLTFGGGIDIMHDGARITYAASYHPVLGMTHALAVGYEPGRLR